ncbi:hypothetical protein FDG86_gp038 [Escherichia phage APECc02]|uniref:Uncharacterized protein n=1 Tax=Escherichia phage APECc02 TaxID=1655314 RepID=A0A0U2DAI6_9CAUD|nr:hypothetical protein FDG86_gp038 [Escherichia phage APECc02]AKO61792.1 hypothetical protein APCEc02_038 [Escherichia phage APECc02]
MKGNMIPLENVAINDAEAIAMVERLWRERWNIKKSTKNGG